jgi:hypothetical protein
MTLAVSGDSITFPDLSTQRTAPSGFGFKNRLINGDMRIDQRNAGAAVTPINSYTVDRWWTLNSLSGKLTAQQNAAAVTPPAGFVNYLGITSTSAYSVLAGDYFALVQSIEGSNVSDLDWGKASASAITISFRVRSSLPGTFSGTLQNAGQTRSYPFTYSVPVANTWTTVSITIPGDTAGTWLTNNGAGVYVMFALGVGATYSGTAGAWAAGNFFSATGATSVVGTSGATFYVTGVQLEKGSTATSFDYRDYGSELNLCQRYTRPLSINTFLGHCYQPTGFTLFGSGVSMRATPSISSSSGLQVANSSGSNVPVVGISVFGISGDGSVTISGTTSGGLVAGNATYLSASPSTTVLSAEL